MLASYILDIPETEGLLGIRRETRATTRCHICNVLILANAETVFRVENKGPGKRFMLRREQNPSHTMQRNLRIFSKPGGKVFNLCVGTDAAGKASLV